MCTLWLLTAINCKCTLSAEDIVVFTATSSQDRSIPINEKLVFDDILTNRGGGYVPAQNEFICPTGGFYMFSISVESDAHVNTLQYIVRNDVTLGGSFSDGVCKFHTTA